jgi:hypothetical protein
MTHRAIPSLAGRSAEAETALSRGLAELVRLLARQAAVEWHARDLLTPSAENDLSAS